MIFKGKLFVFIGWNRKKARYPHLAVNKSKVRLVERSHQKKESQPTAIAYASFGGMYQGCRQMGQNFFASPKPISLCAKPFG